MSGPLVCHCLLNDSEPGKAPGERNAAGSDGTEQPIESTGPGSLLARGIDPTRRAAARWNDGEIPSKWGEI